MEASEKRSHQARASFFMHKPMGRYGIDEAQLLQFASDNQTSATLLRTRRDPNYDGLCLVVC